MANNKTKKETNKILDKPWLMWLAATFYLLLIPGLLLLAITGTSENIKGYSVKIGVSFADTLIRWINNQLNVNLKVIFLLILLLSIPFGISFLVILVYRWFRSTPEFEIPYTRKHFPGFPKVKNLFYSDKYIHKKVRIDELSEKARNLVKENSQQKERLRQFERENTELTTNNKALVSQLEELVRKSNILTLEVGHHINATEEMVKLFDQVLLLINQTDISSYERELRTVLNEFANTITKITFDRINDKHSSIMIVSEDDDLLKIIASNGLPVGSRSRTFKRGQGLAGWIWENGQPAICSDVTRDSRFSEDGCIPNGNYRSIIGVPIMSFTNEVIGTLFVDSRREDVFDENKDIEILSYFAKLLAIIFTDYNLLKEHGEYGGANMA